MPRFASRINKGQGWEKQDVKIKQELLSPFGTNSSAQLFWNATWQFVLRTLKISITFTSTSTHRKYINMQIFIYKYVIALLCSKIKNWRQPKYSTVGTSVTLLWTRTCPLTDVSEEFLPVWPDTYLRISCEIPNTVFIQ